MAYSLAPVCSPATLAGLTICVARLPPATPLRPAAMLRVGVATKRKARWQLASGLLVDSFAPAHSPATLTGLTVHVAASQLAPFWLPPEAKNPAETSPAGFLFWRRPTLARPIAVLPSGLQRFTAVFGMGTGGATALLSPEVRAGRAVSALRADADL